jgi:putative transposase
VVDAYCVMPDHLHFLTLGRSPTSDLLNFAKNFKQKTAYAYLQIPQARLWQKNYYDHILRSNEESKQVAAYIWMNPVRAGICKNFQGYPFSGSFARPWKNSETVAVWSPPWNAPRTPT